MCGRYTLSKSQADIEQCIDFDQAECELKPRFNIAPTQRAPVVLHRHGSTVLKEMQWGLIPFWATDQDIGARMINARAETLREKPAFRQSFKRKRCWVLADSFYEWQKLLGSTRKQPMRVLLRSGEPFVFAGLWDSWKKPDHTEVESFTIITGAANELVRPIHDRMPVILSPQHRAQWLDPEYGNVEELVKLLVPYSEKEMKAHPVSTWVNNPRVDDPKCIEPI